ncbi:hypothetical protein SLEP1_g20284 [Rubroshorea leprosula]|uniref:Aldose 1-epimerase n=1 Tax=Rubroshorea leprosula TaxID=152421 RepID=A0AAV5JCU2_9ROSI|nr:hypothetical protein SLEP1_g20284 [Rubroshorea leprosula]
MAKIPILFSLVLIAAFGLAKGSLADEKDKVGIYELKKGNFCLKFTNWGATIISVVLPDKHGKPGDVVLGYDSVKDYTNDTVYFGAIVGRVANRIAGAQFTLNGTHYKLVANEGKNILHGGPKGFSDVIWNVKKYKNKGHASSIVFSYHSYDGEEGFPGGVKVSVAYTLLGEKQLSVNMKAKALKKATPVNLAQHSYWNLGGHNSGDILSEEVQIFASSYTPVDSSLIPTGKIESVKGTPYDFLNSHTIKSTINKLPNGYDINYVLDGTPGKLRKAAVVKDKKSGRVMKLYTNQPGVQFYTGNYLKDVKGKDGFVYQAHAGLCSETQGFPDSVNHPNFPSQIVNPGQTYKHHMLYKFSVEA